MKKLGLLAAMAMVVTVGGVYATWNYAQTGNVAEVGTMATVVVPEAVVSTVKGSLEVSHNTLSIRIDDLGNDNDHVAELVFEGSLTVTFTPALGADLKAMDLVLDAYFKDTVDDLAFEGTDLFNINGEKLQKTFDLDNDEKTWTINGTDLAKIISINHLELETLEEFTRFRDKMNGLKLDMIITDITGTV